MDIEVYGEIKKGLESHLKGLNLPKSFNPSVVSIEPSKPTYPLVIFEEVRNVPYNNNAVRTLRQNISNLGYRADIYAKQSGSNTKQEIARKIAKHCDEYLTVCVGLRQVSWNTISNDGLNGDLYHIIIMYSAPYWEQRKKFL